MVSFCRLETVAARVQAAAGFGNARGSRACPSPMWTGRAFLLVALLLLALWAPSASAASPSPPAVNPSVTALEHLIDTMQDDKARAAFVAQLQTLIAAERAVTIKAAEPENLVTGLSHRLNALTE